MQLLEIRDLREDDRLDDFACGDDDLDQFLVEDAGRLQALGTTRVYVALFDGAIVGYVALLADAVELKTGERKKLALRSSDSMYLPAVKVGRLAVDEQFRGKNRGTGEALARHAFLVALSVADAIGCRLLTVDAYPASIGFYERLGFMANKSSADARRTTSMRLDLRSLPTWLRLNVVK